MTISRGQMKRQLYEGGGIMSLSKEGIGGGDYKGIDMGSRVGYGLIKKVFRGAKKAVKGVTGAVKDIASSDIGKAALAGAAVYGLGGGTFFGRTLPGIGSTSGFGFKNIAPNLFGTGAVADYGTGTKGILGSLGLTPGFGVKGITKRGIGTAIAGSGLIAGLLTKAQMEEIDEADPDERGDIVAEKLRQSLTRLGYTGQVLEDKVAEGVSEYTGYTSKAEGGRIGFDNGTQRGGISSLAAPKDLELSPEGVVMKGEPDFNRFDNFFLEQMSQLKDKPVLYTDGITYYPKYDTFLDSDANEVSGPSEGAIPIEEQRLKDKVASGSKYLEAAEGGRIGYQDAGPVLPPDPTQPVNPFGPKPPADAPVLPDRMMASNIENDKILEALFEKYLDMGLSPEKAAEKAREEFERMSMMQTEGRGLAAMGGRMNYAMGDTASQNAMQAAGIEGLPVRQNPKGVKELDLRDNGGFIPPVGIKEKEDDIPAMLSNNEFVFTADAVRGMGDGDVELGAQRMYDQMKMLEKGGRV